MSLSTDVSRFIPLLFGMIAAKASNLMFSTRTKRKVAWGSKSNIPPQLARGSDNYDIGWRSLFRSMNIGSGDQDPTTRNSNHRCCASLHLEGHSWRAHALPSLGLNPAPSPTRALLEVEGACKTVLSILGAGEQARFRHPLTNSVALTFSNRYIRKQSLGCCS